jgi:hypothetical protein
MLWLPDGRVLLWGMDPTNTLCSVCREPISHDYTVINVKAELGRLTHGRCNPENIYEQELLGHPHGHT